MKRLQQIIKRFPITRIGVIGDMAADVYIYGKPYRLSREAPVIVVRHDYQKVIPGGAANTVSNLLQLGEQVFPVGVLGNDDAGVEVFNYFADNCASIEGLLLRGRTDTITKTRIMAGDDHTSKQQVIRIDREPQVVLSADEEQKIISYLPSVAPIVSKIFKIIREINREGVTVLLVEQNARAALKLSNRGYVLENGYIALQGEGEELLNNPDVKKAYLGEQI